LKGEGEYVVWRAEVRRDIERRKGRLLYEKKTKQNKTKTKQKKTIKKTILGRLSGLLAHFIMPLA